MINCSASRCASLALCHVVAIDSCSKREVTRLRRRACRWEDFRLRWRYLIAPPAIVVDHDADVKLGGDWENRETRKTVGSNSASRIERLG